MIPPKQLAAAQAATSVLRQFIDERHLSMGGGTVLQSRWRHRQSTDVDLFCDGIVFERAQRRFGREIERALVAEAGSPPERTWVEFMAIYCEPDGVETTLMPHVPLMEAPADEWLPGTRIALQSTAEILAKKLRHRLYEAGGVEVRDLYDLAAARHLDPQALQDAKALLAADHCAAIALLISQLPRNWHRSAGKPLIAPRFAWSEDELVQQAMHALTPDESAPPSKALAPNESDPPSKVPVP